MSVESLAGLDRSTVRERALDALEGSAVTEIVASADRHEAAATLRATRSRPTRGLP